MHTDGQRGEVQAITEVQSCFIINTPQRIKAIFNKVHTDRVIAYATRPPPSVTPYGSSFRLMHAPIASRIPPMSRPQPTKRRGPTLSPPSRRGVKKGLTRETTMQQPHHNWMTSAQLRVCVCASTRKKGKVKRTATVEPS